jgi:hypothetical protein
MPELAERQTFRDPWEQLPGESSKTQCSSGLNAFPVPRTSYLSHVAAG